MPFLFPDIYIPAVPNRGDSEEGDSKIFSQTGLSGSGFSKDFKLAIIFDSSLSFRTLSCKRLIQKMSALELL